MRKLPKDVLKMASGLILPSGLAGHRRPLCIAPVDRNLHRIDIDIDSISTPGLVWEMADDV